MTVAAEVREDFSEAIAVVNREAEAREFLDEVIAVFVDAYGGDGVDELLNV
ncbi:hypothetical protein AGMMS50222_08980 [Endomicrobiia bacterium]|nr:hypothetical protein AGMMS49531_10630 [Endomicrobiia bacterium]GHT64988.1 hypothetical protein AGMMS49556_04030 [Endomicrobiia bacterium]GHT69533.1 hypothetical protein AGMMS49950_02460 [Endomicrobiia bacterium]GHT76435.1 hypothetical protein AGMMS50222_08980 [Endomicrobiia bacterium]